MLAMGGPYRITTEYKSCIEDTEGAGPRLSIEIGCGGRATQGSPLRVLTGGGRATHRVAPRACD